MDLFAFRKPKNELESDEGDSKNVPFVPEEGIDAVTGELSRIVKQFSLMLER